MKGSVGFWVGWLLVLFVLWIALVDKTSASELVTGIVSAAIAATAATAARAAGMARFAPRARWLLAARRLPWAVVRDSLLIVRSLSRRVLRREALRGRFTTVSFRAGGDDARSSARRALAVAGRSVAPNQYAVGIDRDHDALLLHELVPRESDADGRAGGGGEAS